MSDHSARVRCWPQVGSFWWQLTYVRPSVLTHLTSALPRECPSLRHRHDASAREARLNFGAPTGAPFIAGTVVAPLFLRLVAECVEALAVVVGLDLAAGESLGEDLLRCGPCRC